MDSNITNLRGANCPLSLGIKISRCRREHLVCILKVRDSLEKVLYPSESPKMCLWNIKTDRIRAHRVQPVTQRHGDAVCPARWTQRWISGPSQNGLLDLPEPFSVYILLYSCKAPLPVTSLSPLFRWGSGWPSWFQPWRSLWKGWVMASKKRRHPLFCSNSRVAWGMMGRGWQKNTYRWHCSTASYPESLK